MAAESKLQTKIRKELEKRGWYVCKMGLVSKPGWPDLVAIRGGRTVWLEIKRPGESPEELQLYIHEQMRKKGSEVFWFDDFDKFLEWYED